MLKHIETDNRNATMEEQKALAKYVGWGGLSNAFDTSKANWNVEYNELKELLTDQEYKEAKESTLTSFYTNTTVVKAMYQALEHIGITDVDKNEENNKLNFLEPAMGIGNFFGLMPEHLQEKVNLHGIELEPISARIAQKLYPMANIQNIGYEQTFAKDYFNVVFGNVPFGSFKLNDKENPEISAQKFNIHEHFIAKALDQVQPNGIVAFITSSGTMDKANTKERRYIAERANLLGAIRLPNNAFKGIANTEVTSDIIFLQKRDKQISLKQLVELDGEETVKQRFSWIYTQEVNGINNITNDSVSINTYCINNPNMVLGEMTVDNSNRMYGALITTCKPFEGMDLGEQLQKAVKNIRKMEDIAPPTQGYMGSFEDHDNSKVDSILSEILKSQPRNFSYILKDNKIYFYESLYKPVTDITYTLSDNQYEKMKGLIEIKDTCRNLIEAQINDLPEDTIKELQVELNNRYDSYNKKHGLINGQTAKKLFAEDSSYPLLCALEVLDTIGNMIGKSAMFTQRTINPNIEIKNADTAEEALIFSISERGYIDVTYMEKLTGRTEQELFTELIGLGRVFKDITAPIGLDKYVYRSQDEYVSGNIRTKLEKAKSLLTETIKIKQHLEDTQNIEFKLTNNRDIAQKYNDLTQNIETIKHNILALEQVLPLKLEASDIDVKFGTTWIPPNYMADFIGEKLKLPTYIKENMGLTYDKSSSTWGLNKSPKVDDVISREVYGTNRMSALDIIMRTLNLSDIKVYDPDPNDNKKRILNYRETVLVQNMQKKIKREFEDWVWTDVERRNNLVEIYNNKFNGIRVREYDGRHIKFKGMNPEISLREHQKNAVARILYGGNTLLAHEVGAGKTFEIIAAAMESKRLGLCNKSLITVPKHLTEQFGMDFLKLYPNANLLIVRENDFTPHNRKKFCAKISTGNYEAIIMAHSQFEKIPLSKERQLTFIYDQLDELEMAQAAENIKYTSDRNSYTIKQLERRKKQLGIKLENLLNEDYKDNTITFEELGIDRLFVDEAHVFKNLYYTTKMRNVAGISNSESKRATDMFLKCRYLDEITNNKGVIFSTGTPLSNSMAEIYTMQRFLQYDTLNAYGLYEFDDWASTFGETATSYELAPEGNNKYRERRRFAQFFNLPELMKMFTSVADIKTTESMNLPLPIAKQHTIVAKPNEITMSYVQSLSKRAEAVRRKLVEPEQDNMLSITNDGKKIGLDVRIINNLLPDDPNSKLNMCVQNVFDIWNKTKPNKLAQLLFCDLSTPGGSPSNKNGGFNVYDDIREKLVAKGIPREEIKFIHEAKNDAQKKVLFEKVRNGEVRVLLGSTEKMGSGTNVQNKLIALHNLDIPWRPSDLEQRAGRILRQGNNNKEIEIFNYVTENTFDAYLYQTIENKQKSISQIMTSKEIARRFANMDETVLNYAEIKALCSGNPLIKVQLDLRREIEELEIMRKSYKEQCYRLEDLVNVSGPKLIAQYEKDYNNIKADIEMLKQHSYDKDSFPPFTINGVVYNEKKEAGKALLDACIHHIGNTTNSKIGNYRGFDVYVSYSYHSSEYRLSLVNNYSYSSIKLTNNVHSNMTNINSTLEENNLIGLLKNLEGHIINKNNEMINATEQLKLSFPQEQVYQNKLAELEAINIELGIGREDEFDETIVNDEINNTSKEKESSNIKVFIEPESEKINIEKKKSYGMAL